MEFLSLSIGIVQQHKMLVSATQTTLLMGENEAIHDAGWL